MDNNELGKVIAKMPSGTKITLTYKGYAYKGTVDFFKSSRTDLCLKRVSQAFSSDDTYMTFTLEDK